MSAVLNPFGDAPAGLPSVMAGAVAGRENTEVLALIAMARRFPRDQRACAALIVQAFERTGLAEDSQYEFARGGTKISGPSIRAAEAMAAVWGNMASGWSQLERIPGPDGVDASLIEAFAVDYQTTRREAIKFVVRHWRDTKSGGYKLTEERDIYELCANQAQRRKRACILTLLPSDLVEAAMAQADATLKAKADTSPAGIADLVEKFSKLGVTKAMLEKRLQRNLDSMSPAQMVGLKRIGVSLRDGMSDVSEWFEVTPDAAATQPAAGTAAASAAAAVSQTAQQRQQRAKPKEGAGPGAAAAAPAGAPAAEPAAPAAADAPAASPAAPAAKGPSSDMTVGELQSSLLGGEAPVPEDAAADEPLVAEYVGRIRAPAVTAQRALELLDESRSLLKTKQARDRVAAAYDERFHDAG